MTFAMTLTRRFTIALCVSAVVSVAACAAPAEVGAMRFANQPPVWKVNDRADVPIKPAEREFPRLLYFFDAFFFRALTDTMEVPTPRRAINLNALGEGPDSTWFTNRVGVRDLRLAEIARGPNAAGPPDLSGPWTVTGSKVGGRSVGFIMKDQRGIKYIIKFDEAGIPVVETATDVVLQRLLWALGYNVPEDSVVYFKRDRLVLADDAKVSDVFGNKRKMTAADLDDALSKVNRKPDGSYRALASRFLPGIPIGGFAQTGVRKDDPNDRIAHEHRREVRGLYLFFSWLKATDAKEDNTLDVWEQDPKDPNRHYVVHYLVDFGKSLGANTSIPRTPHDNHAYNIDIDFTFRSLLAFGLWKRPWEDTLAPNIPGVAMIDVAHYNPGGYKPQQRYAPFIHKDEYDMMWAAKILMRLSPAHIRTAVEQGQYEDPRAAEYVTQTLIARQRKAARYWFRRTNPLDRFSVTEASGRARLCFSDLLIAYQLETAALALTRYRAASYDYDGEPTGWRTDAGPRPGEQTACLSIALASARDGYTIIKLDTQRGEAWLKPVEVHVARSPEGALRIIGINRR